MYYLLVQVMITRTSSAGDEISLRHHQLTMHTPIFYLSTMCQIVVGSTGIALDQVHGIILARQAEKWFI
jgi:hypothetical protein